MSLAWADAPLSPYPVPEEHFFKIKPLKLRDKQGNLIVECLKIVPGETTTAHIAFDRPALISHWRCSFG
jgi:hypothetical protein